MAVIVTRAGKGSALSHGEMDANFINLNNGKLDKSSNLSDLADASVARTNLGLGSLATQSSATVSITGGTMDGVAIGGNSRNSGAFTTLAASGNITLDNARQVLIKDSGGTARNGLLVTASNNAQVGDQNLSGLYLDAGAANGINMRVAGTTRMAATSSGADITGALGVSGGASFGGITLSSWTGNAAIHIGPAGTNGGALNSNGAGITLSENWYFDGAQKYRGNGGATRAVLAGGLFNFQYAANNASGAGAALTWNSLGTWDSSSLNVATALSANGRITMAQGVGIKDSSIDAGVYCDAGNIYVGKYSTAAGLKVALDGSASVTGAFSSGSTVAKFGSTSTGLAAYIGQTSTTAFIQSALNANFDTEYDLVLQPNGGSAGVGVTPIAKLHVATAAGSPTAISAGVRFYETSNNYGLNIGGDSTYGYIQGLRGASSTLGYNDVVLQPNGGSVGVGASPSGSKFKVGLTSVGTLPTVVNVASFGTSGVVSLGGASGNNDGVYLGTGDTSGNSVASGIGFLREASGWNSALGFYTNNSTAGPNGVSAIREVGRFSSAGNFGLGVIPDSWDANFKAIQLGGPNFIAGNNGGNRLDLGVNARYAGGYMYSANAASTLYVQASGEHCFYTAPSGTAGNYITYTQTVKLGADGQLRQSANGVFSLGSYSEFNNNANGSVVMVVQHRGTNPYGVSMQWSGASPNNTTNYFLNCEDTGGQKLAIRANGGIANIQANNVNLSDLNCKFEFENYHESGLTDKVWDFGKRMRNAWGRFKHKGQTHNDFNHGYGAQLVKEAAGLDFPELVEYSSLGGNGDWINLTVYDNDLLHLVGTNVTELQYRHEALEEKYNKLVQKLQAAGITIQ